MPIKDIISKDVCTVSKDAELKQAAQCMKDKCVGSVVVLEDADDRKSPCGMLTDRDIMLKLLAEDEELNAIKVKDAMSEDLLVVKEDDGIMETIEAMSERNVRRAPVVTADNEVTGVIAFDDLVILLSKEFSQLARVAAQQANS